MQVVVTRVPGRTHTVEIPENGTVGEALNAANLALASSEACKLNGATASLDDRCSEDDRIIVAKGAKGNS